MTIRIAIDCRKFDDFGIGTTIRGIVHGLEAIEPDELEIILLGPVAIRDRVPQSAMFRFVEEHAPHYSLREIHRIGGAAERAGADLLHVPHYVTPATSLPLVTTIHDLIHLRAPLRDLPFGGRVYAKWMLGRAAKRSARIVTVSSAVRDEIEDELPMARGKVVVIPNGVTPPTGSPAPLGQREPLLLFVGNDKPHKNVDRLIEGFSMLRESESRLTLVLVGSEFDRFREIDGVDVRGFVEESELSQLYDRTIALVQPSLMEGFGLPVAEAMAHGAPVIVSAIPPLLEVAGDAAIPIEDPENVDSIAGTIGEALRDRKVLERSASLGPSLAQRFSWPGVASSLVEIWDQVLTVAPRT